jgi:NCS1 family nucleobase:cation symporter-1
MYAYDNGVNWRAMFALIVAVVPVIPGFVRAAATPGGQVADPGWFDALYTYAWFVTFALGALIYLALTLRRRGVNDR